MRDKLPYLFVVGLFGLFACNNLLTRGMFMDGLIYSSVAANMAEGTGSFWHPVYTLTQHTDFFEHPPLMMWLLSLWFRVFGASMAAAKVYSVAVLLASAALMVAVWRRLGFETRHGWLPLLLLTLIPDVPLAAHNNYLESTMTVFVLAAVWLVLRGRGAGWHLAAGLMLALAALTKGPTGLFPLALPLLLWLFGERPGFWRMALSTAAMTGGVVVPLLLLWWCVPDATEFFAKYINRQLVQGTHELVSNRTYVLTALLSHGATVLAPAAAVAVMTCLWREKLPAITGDNWRRAGLMFALVLCGTLPMMVSTKQRAFYLLTVFPFVALSAAALLEPLVLQLGKRIPRRAVVTSAALTLAAAVALNAVHCGKPGRDHALLADMDIIAPHLADGETVAIPGELMSQYNLHGYWYFYNRISLDAANPHRHLLTEGDLGLREWEGQYREIPLPTKEYKLYERVAK